MWKEEDALAGFAAAEHEVSVVMVDEIPFVHHADHLEDRTPEEHAAGGSMLDLCGLLKLTCIHRSVFEMETAIAEKRLKSSTRRPNCGGPVKVVHDRGSHLAAVYDETFEELGKEFGPELNVVVEQKNVSAACIQSGLNTLVIGSSDPEVLPIRDNCDVGGMGLTQSDGVVRRRIIDAPYAEIPENLPVERDEEAGKDVRAVEEDGNNTDVWIHRIDLEISTR